MGVTDNYANEDSFGTGPHELTILSVAIVTGKNTGTQGVELKYCRGQSVNYPANKTLWQGKFFNKFLTSWIVGLGLNPADLQEASKAGRGDDWLFAKLPGRHGIFEFVETDKKSEKTGKPFLEPKSKAETDLAEWIASQNGQSIAAPESEPPMSAYENQTGDIPVDENGIPLF